MRNDEVAEVRTRRDGVDGVSGFRGCGPGPGGSPWTYGLSDGVLHTRGLVLSARCSLMRSPMRPSPPR
jgi:hypothetical protein